MPEKPKIEPSANLELPPGYSEYAGYKADPKEAAFVHVLVEYGKHKFNPETGERTIRPFVIKVTQAQHDRNQKYLPLLGYKIIAVLHQPA